MYGAACVIETGKQLIDRRREPRFQIGDMYALRGPIRRLTRTRRTYHSGREHRVVNISPDGLAFTCDTCPPQEGRRLLLEVYWPGEANPLNVRGIVACVTDISPRLPQDISAEWSHSSAFGVFRVGVRFEHTPELLRGRLSEPGIPAV